MHWELSCFRADATVRGLLKDGQPEPTLATLKRHAVLEAPAVACVLRDSACDATNGKGASMIGLFAWPNV
jgi:hypothetical protein